MSTTPTPAVTTPAVTTPAVTTPAVTTPAGACGAPHPPTRWRGEHQPVLAEHGPDGAAVLVKVFVVVPTLALIAAVPLAWGWGLSWLDVGLAVGFYLLSGARRSPSGSTATSPTARSRPTAALRIALAIAGSHGAPGPRHHLGRRSPPPPRLHRQGGRPALALAVRHLPGRGGQGLLARPLGLAVRPRPDQRRPLRPRPARRPRHRPHRPPVPAAGRWSACSRPALLGGRSAGPGGARSPRSSGPGWSASRCCTTSPGRSTRSAT